MKGNSSTTKYFDSSEIINKKKKKKDDESSYFDSAKIIDKIRYEKDIDFDTFESDYKTVVDQINSATSGWQTRETMKNTKKSVKQMKGRIESYEKYREKFGNGEGVSMSDSIKSFDELLEQWGTLTSEYGRYESSEDYTKALEEIQAATKKREKQKTDNLLYLEKEISSLESAIDEATKRKHNMYNNINQRQTVYYRSQGLQPDDTNLENRIKSSEIEYNEYLSSLGFETIDDMKKALSDKKVYYNQTKLLQNGIALEKIREDAKFEEYAEKGNALGEEKEDGWFVSNASRKNAVAYLRNDKKAMEIFEESLDTAGGTSERILSDQIEYKAAKYMTDDEFKVYNAHLGKGDEESANLYLESIEETLNSRMAQVIAGEQDTTFKKLKYSINAGLDQFEQGFINSFDNESDYIAPTSIQMASGIIRDSLGDVGFNVFGNSLGQVVYDVGTTTSNMLPSILTGASLNVVAPGVGTVVGAGLMGTSAKGNAYQEMLNLGYDKSQAKAYSVMVGISEAALQYALGGITSLGGSVSGKAISSMVEGIDNAIARWSIKLGMNALSEGTEESLQEILTPFFENLVLQYEKNTMADIDWKQVAYSGMLGMLSSIGLEGGTSGVSTYQENASRKNIGANIRANENIQNTLNLANMTPEEMDAYNLYTKYANKGVTAENIKDVQLGHLAESMGADADTVLRSKKSTKEQKLSARETLDKLSYYATPKAEKNAKVEEAKKQAKLKASELKIGEVSEITDSGNSFTLEGRRTEDGETVLVTSEGDIALSEVTLDEKNAMLVAYSDNMGDEMGNVFISNYDKSVDVDTYYEDFTNVYEKSAVGYSNDVVLRSKGSLTASQVQNIHENAINIAKKQRRQVIEAINNKSSKNFFKEGTFDDSVIDYNNETTDGSKVNWKDLNPRQREAITFVKGVSKALGINIVLEKEGKKKGYNGWYDPSDNSIHLDVHAGIDEALDVDTIIPTLSHEMTHWMKAKAIDLYQKMKDFALDTLDLATKERIEEYVQDEIERLDEKHPKEDGSKHTPEEAMDEIVARACEDMLANSKSINEFMSKLTESEQKTFKEKIQKMFKDILNWVNELLDQYKGEARSLEAQVLRRYKNRFEEMSKLWDEALKEAVKTNQAAMEQGTTVEKMVKESQKNAEHIVFGENSMPSEDRMFALRDSENIGKASILYNNKNHLVDTTTMNNGVEVMNAMAKVMIPFLEQDGILPPDVKGKTIFKNGSYGRSGENTTKCVRTLTYEDFKDRVAEELGRPLTVAESLLVSQKIYDIAIDPQCIYCYVASDRKAYDEYIGNYQKQMDTFITRMKNGENADELYIEYLDGRKDTDAQKKRFNNWKKIANNNSPYITQKDIATKRKRDAIISKGGALAEQVRDAQRYAQSASWAKKVEEYRAYKGDILKFSKDLVKTLNEEYGFRMYSFSDYTPAFIVENMQMIIDASARGLKSLAYTKDTDYVKIFGKTGQAINISCFAKYDSATKTYVEDSKQGAKWSEAKALREEYDHVGNVMVCTNDDMVLWALKQDWIDVVIPYHIVKTGTTIANEYDWNNYTSESSDKIGSRNANIYPTEHNNDFATYDRLIDERGITPRFNRFYEMIGDQLTADQYMKLVNEVRLPASELSPVVPVFNLESAMESFGVREDGSIIEGGFVDKGGYFGGWYREGIDVNQEVSAVAKDIADGKSSLDVDYGMNKKAKEKQAEKYGVKQYADRNYAPTFYSHMGKVVDDIKQDKLGANSVVNYLKGKGVKDEEIKWSGIETFLDGKKSVTKAELQEFVAGSMLQIEEHTKKMNSQEDLTKSLVKYTNIDFMDYVDDWSNVDYNGLRDAIKEYFDDGDIDESTYSKLIDLADSSENNTVKWYQYKIEGGKNYRELLFKMPNLSYSNDSMKHHWGKTANGILAHARIQDVKTKGGKKMLFVEEIQSDWHNEGHRQGYVDKNAKREKDIRNASADALREFLSSDVAESIINRLVRNGYSNGVDILSQVFDGNTSAYSDLSYELEGLTKEERAFIDNVVKEEQTRQREMTGALSDFDTRAKTEDAPFKDTYHEYVMKRLIRIASEQGYDSIGWTTGQIQEERWSSDYAEGYRIEYDQDIPKFLRKYGKRWGASVGKTSLVGTDLKPHTTFNDVYREETFQSRKEWEKAVNETFREQGMTAREIKSVQFETEGEYVVAYYDGRETDRARIAVNDGTVWSMDITDDMKQSVLYEGQVMYSDRDSSYKTDEYYKNITPASRKDALHLNMLDERNIARYRREIDGVFDGSLPTGSDVIIGMPSDVLKEYGEVSDRVIRISQRIARKIAYPNGYKIGNTIINRPTELRVHGDMEGKHNLGISALKNLPLQIADPIAITRNNEKNSKKNSVVIWTNWITEDGKGVMLGLVIDGKGATGLQNNVSTVFQADEEYAKRFFENEKDILYTKNNKDINQLLSVRRYMPKARVDDTFIKSLTEKHPDVKYYQDRDARPYGILEEEYRLAEENKALKEDIKGLKYILKIEREKNFISSLDESRIKSAAKYLLEKVDSKYDRTEFEDGMREIYLYIGESENVDGNAVMSKCVDLARRVMGKSNSFESKNKYFDRLISDIQKASANIDGDIESAWNSLATKYPKVFSRDVNTSDMATELLSIMNATKETAEMYKGFNKDQARMSLATEIYNQYWYVSNMDTKNQEIQKLRLDHRKTMEFLRDKNKERLDNQRLADQMYYGKIISKVKKEKDAKYKHMREVGERNERIRKVKIDITKKAMTLNRWLKVNSKKEHINEELKPIVIGFLNTLDFASKTNIDTGGQIQTKADMDFAKSLSQVHRMMEESTKAITGEGKYYGIQFAEGDIQNMRTLADIVNDRLANGQKYVLNQLSLEELQVLHEMVSKLKKGVEMANEFHSIENKQGIVNHAQSMIQDADRLGQIVIHKGVRGWFDSMLNFKNKVPHYFFKMLGENGMKVFKAFQDGWDTFARNVHQVIQFTNNLYKAKEVKEWRKEIHTIEHRGKEIKMTVPQLMALYCLSKREQALKHITQGGIHISDIDNGKSVIAQNFTVHFTEAELKRIFKNELSERQIYVAEKLQEFMNTVCTEWGNEVTMKLYGIDQFGLENFYFPIKSDPENINKDEKQTANENPLFRLLNMSFSKPLNEDASNRIMVLDIFEVFAAHTSDMAKYNALALPVIDTYKLLNYKERIELPNGEHDDVSLKRSMNTAYGKEAIGYIYEFLKDLNGTENTSRDSIGGKFFSYAKIAAVAGNIRVALLQPTAYVKARLVMKDKYLRRALLHKPSTIKRNYERAMKYCGMVLWKSMGFYDTNISRGVLSQITHDESLRDKMVEISMKGAEKGDQITLAYLWTACEHEIRNEREDLKVGTEEFYEAIGLRLRDIIYATQVVDSTVTRSSLMRSGNLYDKMLTAFGSEPTLSLNMLQDAFLQYKLTERSEGKEIAIKKHRKNVWRATSTYALTSIVVSFIATAMDMYRDNDDDEEEEGKFMKAYIGNLTSELGVLGKIPYIKEFISYLNGFSSTRTDTQWMEQFSNTVNGMAKVINGKGNLYTVAKNLLRTMSSLSGLPIFNLYRDFMAGTDKLGILEEEDVEEMFKDMQ